MPYISGSQQTFISRLHQFGNTTGIINTYITEGNSLITNVKPYISGHWEKEARKRKYLCTHLAANLITQCFGVISNIPRVPTNVLADIVDAGVECDLTWDTPDISLVSDTRIEFKNITLGQSYSEILVAAGNDNLYQDFVRPPIYAGSTCQYRIRYSYNGGALFTPYTESSTVLFY